MRLPATVLVPAGRTGNPVLVDPTTRGVTARRPVRMTAWHL